MTFLMITAFLVVLISFMSSVLEAVILSVTHAHVEVLKKKKPKAGAILQDFKTRIDKPIAAILTLNTISHTAGSTIIGALVLKLYGDGYVAISSAILTLVILIFAEIIPKTIGARYWKQLAPISAYSIKVLVFFMYPFVVLSNRISRMVGAQNRAVRITREEMLANVEMGETEGILQKKETLIIKNLLKLNSIFVKDVMTPRSVLMAYQKDQTINEIMDEYKSVPFSRVPIYDKDLDNIVGMIFRYEFLELYGKDQGHIKLEEFMHPIHTVHQNNSIAMTLDEFIKRREHMFLAVDDYGGTMGIVTLEDAVETLLGVEIMDETDDVEDMRKLALERWEKRKSDLQKHQKVLSKKNVS
jgi:CBS domain containing-hemolysin-like protein